MGFDLLVGDAPILDRHVLRQKTGAVALSQMRAQHEVGRQESPRLAIPVHAATADTVRRHEGAPGADRQRRLVHLVAEGEGGLVGTQEQLVADAIAQLVLGVVGRIVGRRISPGAPLDRDHVESGVGQFVGHDRAASSRDRRSRHLSPAACAPCILCLAGSPVSAPRDADGWMRIALVVTGDPVAIVVADARKADHLPADHVADCHRERDRRRSPPARP